MNLFSRRLIQFGKHYCQQNWTHFSGDKYEMISINLESMHKMSKTIEKFSPSLASKFFLLPSIHVEIFLAPNKFVGFFFVFRLYVVKFLLVMLY